MCIRDRYAVFFYPWRTFAARSIRVRQMQGAAVRRMMQGLLAAAFGALPETCTPTPATGVRATILVLGSRPTRAA